MSGNARQHRGRVGVHRHAGGIVGQRLVVGQSTQIHLAVGSRENLGRQPLAVRVDIVDEQRLRRNGRGRLEGDAEALEPVDAGKRQPGASAVGPRPHGDDHRIGRHLGAVDAHATHAGRRAGDFHALHATGDQGRTETLRLIHERPGETSRMHLRRGVGAAEPRVYRARAVQPGGTGVTVVSADTAGGACGNTEGRHLPVAVIDVDATRELGVHRVARARQRPERRAIAPVEGEKSARFSRGGAGDLAALDNRRGDATQRQMVSDGCTDDTGAADDDAGGFAAHPRRAITRDCARAPSTSSTA